MDIALNKGNNVAKTDWRGLINPVQQLRHIHIQISQEALTNTPGELIFRHAGNNLPNTAPLPSSPKIYPKGIHFTISRPS